MNKQRATTISKLLNSRYIQCFVDNDFNEDDQFYVRVHWNDRQFQIKGNYSLKFIEVGIPDKNGFPIGWKVLMNYATIEKIKQLLTVTK